MENYQYKTDFLEMVFATLHNYEILEIEPKSVNVFSKKEKHVLDRLKVIYSDVKLFKDYKLVSLEHISDSEILEIANSFLISIFPKFEKQILELDDLIQFDDYSIYEAGLKFRLNKDKVFCHEILIPTDGTKFTSSILVHEKVHALTLKNIELRSLFINNLELFPMIIQRIMLENLGDQFCQILDCIVRLNDAKQAFHHLDFSNSIKKDQNKSLLDKYVYEYFQVQSYNYLISELYSNLLLKYYLFDKDTMIEKLNQVFSKKISIMEFLNGYNINLLNKDLIPTIKEETNKCKRISIIP